MYNMDMAGIPLFEWHEPKRQRNLVQHGIDFADAKEIWQGAVVEVPSAQEEHGEHRYIAYGVLEGRIIAVVFTWRGTIRRLISARRARTYERRHYQNLFGQGR
jgi:uncharacterized DUF497 family protein